MGCLQTHPTNPLYTPKYKYKSVDAEQRIKNLLESVREEGILQSEIHERLGLSKSTVSEILSLLEENKEVFRKRVSGKSYRVWLSKYSPEPVRGIARVGILRASEYPKVVSAAEKVNAFVRVYDSSIELTKDLVHGHVDIAASPFVTQAVFGVLMKSIKIVRKVAMNGSGVVYSGRKSGYWGCSEFSTMERNLRKYLEVKDLKERIRYFKSPESMIKSLHELKGIAIWEPYFTMIEGKKEPFNEIIGDFVCCSLALNNTFAELNPEIVDKFLTEFDRAKAGSKEATKLSRIIGFTDDVIEKSFDNYIFDPEQTFTERELEELRLGGVKSIISLE